MIRTGVRLIRHQWIPMTDGCRLAGRIWLPAGGAGSAPVPALLEYLPYRKNDATAGRDALIHPFFAAHGYASVRVDLRGSGDSEGTLEDEYLPVEQEDGCEVIRWITRQPWCNGSVGMFGKSWGGFNSLQVAARRPPGLGAVISVCSTHDRYGPDIHHIGGCVSGDAALSWATTMLAYNARPPDPEVVGEQWRDRWLERMERTPAYAGTWLAHQRRDGYWKQGSVGEDWSAISCPVYLVGGWEDLYRVTVLRFLEQAQGPVKGLIGPWAHLYPHEGRPGPAIGFLTEALRWWDRWLKGTDNGIDDEPRLRLYAQDAARPAAGRSHRRGRWVSEPAWPSPNVASQRWHLTGDGGLAREGGPPAGTGRLSLLGTESCGTDAGPYLDMGGSDEVTPDQRGEDGRSLTFTSRPLAAPVGIVGEPLVEVEVASDRPQALLAARLCDVWPDGASTLVSRGLLNLSHRDSHESPRPLEPGRPYRVAIALEPIAYTLPAGHRLRVALSPTYWPWAWPSPAAVTISLVGNGFLDLPARAADAPAEPPPAHFGHPEGEPGQPPSSGPGGREVRREVAAGTLEITSPVSYFPPRAVGDTGLEYGESGHDTYRITEGDPLSAFTASERDIEIGRGEWRTRVRAFSTLSSTATDFQLTAELEGWEGDRRVFARTWHRTIARDEG